jgi:tetratricopeptide (TPR) repeat protein
MKFFRKKKESPARSGTTAGDAGAEHNFYQRHSGETPLDDFYESPAAHQTLRTSRHSPARRRESSNRASNWAIFMLLARAVLIVVLLLGGFVVLKLVLDHMGDPSEKEQQKWEENAARMEKTAASESVSSGAVIPQAPGITPALIEQRLDRWALAEQLLRSAEAFGQRGIDDDAIQRLGQALRIAPDNRAAQQQLAGIYLRRGLYAEAVPLFIRLLDQNSRDPEVQMNLLQALRGSGQIAAGLALAERLLENQPNNKTLLSIAADGQIALGNQAAALALFERILANDDEDKGALEGCGTIYAGQGAWEKAEPYYLELVRLDPKIEYYQRLARCYAQQNQAGKSVIFMGQAASLFGAASVSPWLRDAGFDPIRETVEFRSFADRTVGIETRKAIEAISRREAEKKAEAPGGLELPQQPSFNPLESGK